MNIVLVGFKGSGKTTIGQALAKKLNRPFIDTDYLVEIHYEQMNKKNLCCKDIFQQHGECFFREIEKTILLSLTTIQNHVIALGGGTLCKETQSIVQQLGLIYYLSMPKKQVFAYQTTHSPEEFETVYIERKKLFESLAHETLLPFGE